MSLLTRSLLAAALTLTAVPALATAQDTKSPVGQTLGEIARKADQPAAAGPAAKLPAATNLPTLGEVVKRQEAQAKAATPEGCTRPKVPEKLPDGKTATEPQMREAQIAIKAYVTDSEAFNVCLDKLVKASQAKLSVQEYLALTQQYDLTITAVQVLADRFNEQLHIFKARANGQ